MVRKYKRVPGTRHYQDYSPKWILFPICTKQGKHSRWQYNFHFTRSSRKEGSIHFYLWYFIEIIFVYKKNWKYVVKVHFSEYQAVLFRVPKFICSYRNKDLYFNIIFVFKMPNYPLDKQFFFSGAKYPLQCLFWHFLREATVRLYL